MAFSRNRNKLASISSSMAKCLKQEFEHLIILDFEATCGEKIQPNPQEIIEFPAIILNTSTAECISEFHQYVKPRYHPQLSPFCTELTGIIQSVVDNGLPIENVLNDFDKWLQSNQVKLFAFVTCGDWDLGKQLPFQCKFYNIPIPQYFYQWINLKQIFANHTGTWPRGMTHMLSMLNLPLIGHHHSGIDDCRNISNIAKVLLKEGANFTLTSSISSSQQGSNFQS